MPSYLQIARQVLRQADPPDSAYSERITSAFRQIEKVCPPGALRWARQIHPTLTDRIDAELIEKLGQIWANRFPITDFEAALNELVRLHAEVGKLFANRCTGE
jgi:hypothetical protein